MSAAPCVAVIPARWASSRFPGKPLAALAGKPLVVHVLERARASRAFDEVWVATDDDRIAGAVRQAGGGVRLTRADHTTGTARVAEAAAGLPPEAIVFNVQGDEPLVPPELLAALVERMRGEPGSELVTAAHPDNDPAAFASPHAVKVVVDGRGRALYFSRAPIPYAGSSPSAWLRHVGVYGFRASALTRFVQLPAGKLETREGLEQLRALENGMRIDVLITDYRTQGVDTPADLEVVAKLLERA